jgi:hypothetical protein
MMEAWGLHARNMEAGINGGVNTGVDYLRNVGQVVAEALGNMGIDVDVDVEHQGKKDNIAKAPKPDAPKAEEKAPEPAKETPMETEPAKTDKPTGGQTPEVEVFDNGAWQFVEKSGSNTGINIYPQVPTAPPVAADQASTSGQATNADRNSECLAHLLNMGFTNENAWLEAIVAAKDGDLNQVLNALQWHRK